VKKFTQTSGFSIVTALANNKNPATIQYATGALGGRWMPDATPDAKPAWFAAETGRHQDGSNFVLADGHARWSTPAQVSSGADADAADCRQGNLGSQPADCSKALAANAAGTDSPAPFSLTFSTE
jgi:prepilin-type processing-associated H-X9-DG protein